MDQMEAASTKGNDSHGTVPRSRDPFRTTNTHLSCSQAVRRPGMEKKDASLQDYSISALLNFGVDPRGFRPWFAFAAQTQLLTVHIDGLVYMGFSRDWTDRFSDDSDVMEVQCEKRRLTDEELEKYDFQLEATDTIPELTIITVQGNLVVKIICDSYSICLEPLTKRYPQMV
jgi:hypothetical protein